ncbi:DUF4279 domain-containing protein [Variovorax sp. PBL-H6]|uniref:DUF4279 domain-containing protein n=1 Tax=Variovorax sp. PBL-H6 TaxID=434009 RepID=UPI0013A578A5|nr:DUF4279 domain-containing protein [Variovorax sp. PBL-H6]
MHRGPALRQKSANSPQRNAHFQAQTMLNCTELIFCRDTVEPDFVTHTLDLQPTHSYKVGDVVAVGDIQRPSSVGMWKLRLPDSQTDETVEEQLARWLTILGTKRERMGRLRQLGYSPYLDCRAEKGSLSLCIEPVVLAGLGTLGIALSVWLYEAPATEFNACE